jgi:hypothetical protein
MDNITIEQGQFCLPKNQRKGLFVFMAFKISIEKMQNVLREIRDYVYVVGDYARGTQTEESPIELNVKDRPLLGIDELETYFDMVMLAYKNNGVQWQEEPLVQYTKNTPYLILTSSCYGIDEEEEPFQVRVLGVPMWAKIEHSKPYKSIHVELVST